MNDTAREIAQLILDTAQDNGFLDEPLAIVPELAEEEHKLFVRMIEKLSHYRADRGDELSQEEISSLFTFVFAKAAELLTNFVNNKLDDPVALDGMFDGKVPLYADDELVGFFKKCPWPTVADSAYIDRPVEPGEDPLLALFEALKWTFRVSLHLAAEHLEERGKLRLD